MNTTDWQALAQLYPALEAAVPANDVEALAVMDVPAGTTLFREQERCGGFPLLLSGEVRVSRSASSGRELELYRVVPGWRCWHPGRSAPRWPTPVSATSCSACSPPAWPTSPA
jgi:CRP/FNR family transcriptional regulator